MLKELFTQHPNTIDETYLQHLRFAWTFSTYMLLASIVSVVHGLFPFMFLTTGSDILHKLIQKCEHRGKNNVD